MKNFIAWAFGIVMIIVGLILMIGGAFLPGSIFAFIGLTLMPNFRAFLIEKTNIVAGADAKKLIYFVLWLVFIGSTVYWSISEQQKQEVLQVEDQRAKQKVIQSQREARLAKLKKEQEDRKAYFDINKESIIKDIKSLKDQKEYLKALEKINLYAQGGDKDLIVLKDDIESLQRKIEIEIKTVKIFANLKTIPAANIDENYKLYKELVEMHPKNDKYQKKMSHYKDKVIEREAKIAAEKIFYGEEPVRSSWDGSYREVEKYLESVAHDPSSIDIENCTEP